MKFSSLFSLWVVGALCATSASALLRSENGYLVADGFRKDEGSIFRLLLREWKEIPDENLFIKNCSALVGKLLPILRAEYTGRQVPKILFHECSNYATKNDFKTVNTTLEEGEFVCKKCATRLGAEFLGNQNYDSWCAYVHQVLTREMMKDHYYDLHKGYLKDMKGMQNELKQLQRELEELRARKGLSKEDEQVDKMKKYWDSKGELPCCPAGCKPCDENGEPLAPPKEIQLLRRKLVMAELTHHVYMQDLRGEKVGKEGGLFRMLVKEWKEIPDKDEFVKNCTQIVSKLMPILRAEYTGRQVPKVLFHECDNYATKNDFKTVNTTLKEGQHACQECAKRLGAEFLGNQNYKSWCEYVFDFLSREMLKDHYRDIHKGLLDDMAGMRKQLEELRRAYEEAVKRRLEDDLAAKKRQKAKDYWSSVKDLECCPEACRPCFDEDGNLVNEKGQRLLDDDGKALPLDEVGKED